MTKSALITARIDPLNPFSYWFFLILLSILTTLAFPQPSAAGKSYLAEHFDVTVDVQPGGDLLVTEDITFRFEGGPFTYVFRELAFTELDDIQFLNASINGKTQSLGAGAGQVEVNAVRPLKVTWHFAPVSDASYTFSLSYRVEGAIRKEKADTLTWRVVPEEHAYTIRAAKVTLGYPATTQLVSVSTLNKPFQSTSEGNRVTMRTSNIDVDESLILKAEFNPESLISSAPLWQTQDERNKADLLTAIPLGILALFLTLFMVGGGLFLFIRQNPQRSIPKPTQGSIFLPSDLAPAYVAKLLGLSTGIISSLFDLAEREMIYISQETGKFGNKTYWLERKPFSLPLKPHEQHLLDILLPPNESKRKLTDVGFTLIGNSAKIDQSYETELAELGLIDLARKKQKSYLIIFWLIVLIFSILFLTLTPIVGLIIMNNLTIPLLFILLGIGLGFYIVSIIGLVYSGKFSVLTDKGMEEAKRWRGFQEGLKRNCEEKQSTSTPYFSYLVVFGLGEKWLKQLQSIENAPLPEWLKTFAGEYGDYSGVLSIMSAFDSSNSSSSGDSGGASGGGSSGAG